MKIVAQNGDTNLEFYVSRVQDATRIPKSGKSIKRSLQEQFFLSEEVQGVVSHAGVFIIAYDIDIIRGLGTISLDLLTPISGKVFQSTTIYEFIVNATPLSTERPMPETIQSTPVKRSQPDKLAVEKQNGTELARENMGNGRARKLVEKKSQQA